MKYLVVDDCTKSGLGVFVEEFETEKEAVDRAEDKYYELKENEAEFKKRTTLYVLESSNPDENSEDHLDGKLVIGYIIGGCVRFLDSAWEGIEDYMEEHDDFMDLSGEELEHYADLIPSWEGLSDDDRFLIALERRTPLRRFMYADGHDEEKFQQDYEEEKNEYENIVEWYDMRIGDIDSFFREYGIGSYDFETFIEDACEMIIKMESSNCKENLV